MALKHTLAAGIAAFSLLVTPVGLTVQWQEHGPAITATPAVSTALAAPNRPTPKKPPASGGPTFTQTGTASKTTGWQTGSGKWTDKNCATAADAYDAFRGMAYETDDQTKYNDYMDKAEAALDKGLSNGCAFSSEAWPV